MMMSHCGKPPASSGMLATSPSLPCCRQAPPSCFDEWPAPTGCWARAQAHAAWWAARTIAYRLMSSPRGPRQPPGRPRRRRRRAWQGKGLCHPPAQALTTLAPTTTRVSRVCSSTMCSDRSAFHNLPPPCMRRPEPSSIPKIRQQRNRCPVRVVHHACGTCPAASSRQHLVSTSPGPRAPMSSPWMAPKTRGG